MIDNVNHPAHYTSHPSGIECIQITEHLSFCMGNAVKYLWRNEGKNGIEDLKKAIWYIEREIALRRISQIDTEVKILSDWIDKTVNNKPILHSEQLSRLVESIVRQLDAHKRNLN